jgi:hypothetical protein
MPDTQDTHLPWPNLIEHCVRESLQLRAADSAGSEPESMDFRSVRDRIKDGCQLRQRSRLPVLLALLRTIARPRSLLVERAGDTSASSLLPWALYASEKDLVGHFLLRVGIHIDRPPLRFPQPSLISLSLPVFRDTGVQLVGNGHSLRHGQKQQGLAERRHIHDREG